MIVSRKSPVPPRAVDPTEAARRLGERDNRQSAISNQQSAISNQQ
jgi:hypothetical protein